MATIKFQRGLTSVNTSQKYLNFDFIQQFLEISFGYATIPMFVVIVTSEISSFAALSQPRSSCAVQTAVQWAFKLLQSRTSTKRKGRKEFASYKQNVVS